MSVATLSDLWAQVQTNAAAQNSANSATAQTSQDWLTSLLSATGTVASAGSISSTGGLSDQMQALLVQLQGGNTVAPDASTQSASASGTPATGATEATSGHHHHHHHAGGSEGIDQSTDDLASDAAGSLTGSDATGLDNSSGSFVQNLKDILGSAAQGAATGAVMAAI